MNSRPFLALLLIALTASTVGAQPPTLPQDRTIIDATGRPLKASVLAVTKDALKIRRLSDNKEFEIPLSNLSAADQKFAAELSAPALPQAPVAPVNDAPKSPTATQSTIKPEIKPDTDIDPIDYTKLFENIPSLEVQLKNLEKNQKSLIEAKVRNEYNTTERKSFIEKELRSESTRGFTEVPLSQEQIKDLENKYSEILRLKVVNAREGTPDAIVELFDFFDCAQHPTFPDPSLFDLLRLALSLSPESPKIQNKMLIRPYSNFGYRLQHIEADPENRARS